MVAATTILVDMSVSTVPVTTVDVTRIEALLVGAEPSYSPDEVRWAWLVGWRDDWGQRHGLCASYRALSNRIVIPRHLEVLVGEEAMIGTYCHELKHAEQRHRMGLFRYLVAKVLARRFLEGEAEMAEEAGQLEHADRSR